MMLATVITPTPSGSGLEAEPSQIETGVAELGDWQPAQPSNEALLQADQRIAADQAPDVVDNSLDMPPLAYPTRRSVEYCR